MAELSISITQPEVSGEEPTATNIVSDVVVQEVVTDVTTTDTVPNTRVTEVVATSSFQEIAVSSESVGGMSTPTTELFARGLDQVSLTETFSIAATYRKIFTEQQSASDNYRIVYFGKVFADTLPFTDVLAKYYRKVTEDVFAAQDTAALQPSKVALDQVTKADQAQLTPGKVAHDTILSSDVYSYVVDYNRVFTDYIDATDDFFGQANIDDDQTARFGKNTVDYAHTQSTYSVNFSTTKSDSYIALDAAALSVTKPFFSAAVSEDTNQYSLGKVVHDTNLVDDLNLKAVEKVLEHAVVQQDVPSVLVDKQLAELGSIADLHTISVTKLLAHSFTSYDTIITVLNSARIFTDTGFTTDASAFSVATIKQDTAHATDSAGKTITKPFTSEFNLSDSFSYTAAYNRTFQDTVNSTDDFFGEANIDDDQVARFGKNVLEYVTLSESLSVSSAKQLVDLASLVNPISLETTKVFVSNFTKADQLVIAAGKTLSDLINTTESVTNNIGKTQLDSFQLVDPVSIATSKSLFSLNLALQDSAALDAAKVLSDTTSYIADEFSVTTSYNRSFSDTITVTDDFFGEANIDDDQTVRFGKNVVDYTTLFDVASISTSKQLTSTFTLSDPVSLYSTKVLATNFTKSDELSLEARKALSDVLSTAELVSSAVGKNQVDSLQLSDPLSISAAKVLDPLNIISEDFTALQTTKVFSDTTNFIGDDFSIVVSYSRNFSDILTVTDDFFGEANIDDDQTARFGKNVVDYAIFSESLAFDSTKLLESHSNLSDQISLGNTKILSDTFITTDLFSINSTKAPIDSLVLADSAAKYSSKKLIDSGLLADSLSKGVEKVLSTSFTNTDALTISSTKALEDSLVLTDSAAKYSSKALIDISQVIDPASLSTTKVLSTSTNSISDDFSKVVGYNRSFTDTVNSTDDFFGEANIDDDQVARFGKNVVESLLVSEAASFDLSIIRSDNYSVADFAYLNVRKNLASEFSNTDSATFYIYRQLLDTIATSEAVVVSTDKSLSDTATKSDTVSKASTKQALDVFASTEISYINAGKVTSDILYIADVLTFLKYTSPMLYENVSVADSGFINNQSYFAGAYVEPGYVGTNTNFT